MKIALIGYGKMGKAIERIAISRGHEIILRITSQNPDQLNQKNLSAADVAIEFTGPETAASNLVKCADAGISVVCGSTGWLNEWNDIRDIFEKKGLALIYTSNFSIGVNIFFELNRKLAALMVSHPEYAVELTEIHHTQKKDSPSGTAITLADQILEEMPALKRWVNRPRQSSSELPIISERVDPAPGTHKMLYQSAIDEIEIIHTAHNREGFAGGAVLAAEFMQGKKGVYTMKDVLGL